MLKKQIVLNNQSLSVFRPKYNLGFYNSIHHFFQKQSYRIYDYVVASNPDIVFDITFIDALSNLKNKEIVYAPNIKLHDGSDQILK